jgi:hypothetical protein
MFQEEVIMQKLEFLIEKVVQVQKQGEELTNKFHIVAEVVKGMRSA